MGDIPAVMPGRLRAINTIASLIGPLLLNAALPALAQPALDQARQAGTLTIYPDIAVPGRFYYLPGPLEVVTDQGRPSVHFLLTRRTGTFLTGDQNETRLFAHLSFDVARRVVGAEALESARLFLVSEGVSRPELRILPLRRTEAQVVFVPLGGGEEVELPEGDFELREPSESNFSQRRYTLRLNRHSAEAVWMTLEKGQALVSFSYSYIAEGVLASGDRLEIEGQTDIGNGFQEPDALARPAEEPRTVRADAIQITLDPEQDADLLQVIDLSAERPPPPGHGVLDVRCYDFRSALRTDLAVKMVELEGEAVNGRTARKLVVFRAADPDAAVHRVRFPFAVRLSQPLRYRVREIATNGEELDSGWRERSWLGVLDVTTPHERLLEIEAGGGNVAVNQ